MRLAVPLIALLIGASAAAQQNGVITGTVVDGATGKPVGAAVVSMAGAGMTVNTGPDQYPRILTAGDGRFVFRDLAAPGNFTITATKGGYAPGSSGQRRADGESQPVELNGQQTSRDVVIRLWKYGAMTGMVIDETGEPVVGVQVRAMTWRSIGGRRLARAVGQSVFTDDRGIYRIGSLGAGEYLVFASPPLVSVRLPAYNDAARTGRASGPMPTSIGPNAATLLTTGDVMLAIPRGAVTPPPPVGTKLQIYPTTFHPGSLSPARASTVVLAAGEERSSIDVQLQPVSAARVSGTIVSPGSVPTEMVRLVTTSDGDAPPEVQGSGAFPDQSGAFTFAAVIPGQYKLQATAGSSSGELFFADLPLTVSGDDIDGLAIMLSPALKVSGRLQFDGSTGRPEGYRGNFVPFALEPVDTGQPGAPPGRSGAISDSGFTFSGFLPGRYVVRVANSPQGWMFKGAMLNGVDVSETPFELSRDTGEIVVTFTDRWSGVSGTVQGRGNDEAAVIVFPTDAQRWTTPASSPRRLKRGRTNARGEFGFTLPPGDYFIVAIPDDQSDDWRNPATLDGLARLASRFSIGEGQHETLAVQLRQVRQ
jgi:hypothetical protein